MVFSYRLAWSTEPEVEPPFIQLSVVKWTKGVGDGALLISPALRSDDEINAYVARLKHELDVLASEAKAALQKRRG